MVLPIPAHTPNDFGQTLYKLMQLAEIVGATNDNEIIIDLTQTRFLNCIYLSGLYNFIRNWRIQGKLVVIHSDGPISEYLEVIHFESEYNILKCPELTEDILKFSSKRYTPVVVFPTVGNSRENCINTVLDLIHTQTGVKGGFRSAVDYFVSELTNNIADHSGCAEGVISAQTYPGLGFIDIAFADQGVGLYKAYWNSGKHFPSSEEQAIQMAVSGHSTKDLSITRGFGLSTSKKMLVKGLGGKFVMWSGGALLIETPENRTILGVSGSYNGCFLALRLPLNSGNNFNVYDYVE